MCVYEYICIYKIYRKLRGNVHHTRVPPVPSNSYNGIISPRKPVAKHLYIHIYMYICMFMYTFIYIYIENKEHCESRVRHTNLFCKRAI